MTIMFALVILDACGESWAIDFLELHKCDEYGPLPRAAVAA